MIQPGCVPKIIEISGLSDFGAECPEVVKRHVSQWHAFQNNSWNRFAELRKRFDKGLVIINPSP